MRKSVLVKLAITIGAIVVATLVFFGINNAMLWMSLNNPFQSQWTTIQLSDGEILYGHLAGVTDGTIGLKDVYLLQKITPPDNGTSTSGNFAVNTLPNTETQTQLIAVPTADFLFVTRTSVLYFKFVQSNDPALPYLK